MAENTSAACFSGVVNFRDTVKWLAASLAGLGALFIAGTPLSNLGSLSGWRLGVAVGAGVGGIACILCCLDILLGLLKPSVYLVEEIAERDAEPGQNFKRWLQQHKERKNLKEKKDLAKRIAENAGLLLPSESESLNSFVKDLKKAKNEKDNQDNYEKLQNQARIIDEHIMAWTLEHRFERARWTLLPTSFFAALLLITFAWAANPPKPVPGPQVIIEQFP